MTDFAKYYWARLERGECVRCPRIREDQSYTRCWRCRKVDAKAVQQSQRARRSRLSLSVLASIASKRLLHEVESLPTTLW